jgi:hypothetical protein
LAAWVTHPGNRAFARATANRVWALLMGRAAVEPVDDISPELPQDTSDPQYLGLRLLDVLADDFVRHEFDLRRLFLLVAQSAAFQRQAAEEPAWSDDQLEQALDSWATFRLTRLRPEQVSGAMLQATSVQTIDHESHVLWRTLRATAENDFVRRYGDAGEDELLFQGGTIPQRLVMLNGGLAKDRTRPNPVINGATQVAMLAPDDGAAVEAAYLSVLTRLPTPSEREHFTERLRDTKNNRRQQVLEDLYWALLNDWQFSWNH